ncbi:hypothetical protein OKA05_05050 [Luteolibacter arcticus]|uniref:DOMON-like domain-containing protein n=1 Tax=Luteolibacter arcticus TaxID=1581411 RepID=A0ABT3GE72_9BACT|nr:hypothetical protein [Luteolibacter arcticus]MCW1921908.1 hypothetical protein [Luteolibacter arcticus]
MTVIRCAQPLVWGELDVPLFGISKDWYGAEVAPQAAFCVAVDPRSLWFVASHPKPAKLHPAARPARFVPELWKYDVAELFLTDPTSGRYFEFNLSPNAAWWSCEFTAPRQRAEETDIAFPDVATFAELAPDGGWVAAMAISREVLEARLNFGETTKLNVTFILGSPEQRFLSAVNLGEGEADFHRPERFSTVKFVDA